MSFRSAEQCEAALLSLIRQTDVLIVGAGPTGLVLALWLTRLGVRLRIVDKLPEPATTTRAVAVQARTLEFYRQIGMAEAVVARGRTVTGVNLWVAGRHAARAPFGNIGADITPYPYVLIFSQDEHEHLLVDRLRDAGVLVERRTELVDFDQTVDRTVARLKLPDGRVEECEAAYVAGCDGAHSSVRETLSIGFPGGTYSHLFYVADVDARGPAIDGDVHVALDRTDFLALFPMTGDHRVRLVGTIRDDVAHDRDDLSWNDVAQRVIEWMHIHVDRVNWFSTYRVHHRVAERFRDGRAFLVGDAAHIHSPVGGQGMNTGIGDAVNLAWKVAAVVHGKAPAALLDTLRDGADRVRSTARRDDRSGVRRRDEPQRCGPDRAVAHRARRDPDAFCVSNGAAIALSDGLAIRSELPAQQPE